MAEKKPFKVEIDGEVLDAVKSAFDRKKIGYWDGAEAVFRWFAAQDGMLQSLILGQVDEKYRGEVARMVLDELAGIDRQRPQKRPGVFGTIAAKKGDPTKGAD